MIECESGWKKFGDNCYKNMGSGHDMHKAQDLCSDQGSDLLYPESLEEMQWVKSLMDSTDKMFIGYKGFDHDKKILINMDNTENTGSRPITSKFLNLEH